MRVLWPADVDTVGASAWVSPLQAPRDAPEHENFAAVKASSFTIEEYFLYAID